MHVVVVGAGPSGLLLTLRLAQSGIKVTLLESEDRLDDRPRAAHYGPAGVLELDRAGLLDEIRRRGIIPNDLCFRKLDGSMIVKFKDSSQAGTRTAMTSLSLGKLGEIMLEAVMKQPLATVKWNHKVLRVEQDEQSASAIVQLKDGSQTIIQGDYLCGCDGANSQVRKSLFGDMNFPGKTWDTQIVATNVYYPFEKFGWEEINFIIHPDHFFMAAKLDNQGLWRVSYGEETTMKFDQVLENQPKRFEMLLPGNPKKEEYKITSCSPYRIHQRCAEKFRVGRIALAADAAHLCNPFGGLGLTGGLTDVGGLYQCLSGINQGKCDESILDKYAEIRRNIYDMIDIVSSANFERVSSKDPDRTAREDPFFQLVEQANEDPAVKKKMDESAFDISHDFTQYYNKIEVPSSGVV
ncbi:hypothetical protein VTL71DRAFT_331 [Oculimacula yallundae]|uniref:FAD-binding domain-containing protein n=1 Tax=Oculimacula yallundae TaxID=86028 RepID=A0ABR4CZU5_9HELO